MPLELDGLASAISIVFARSLKFVSTLLDVFSACTLSVWWVPPTASLIFVSSDQQYSWNSFLVDPVREHSFRSNVEWSGGTHTLRSSLRSTALCWEPPRMVWGFLVRR